VLGLTSAFLYAGVTGIVSSLWRVDDQATGELMQHFYHSLADGHQVAHAIQIAQKKLLESVAYQHLPVDGVYLQRRLNQFANMTCISVNRHN
jgi:CHAT domain-containing protein